MPFINVHTHFKPQDKNEIVLRNAFLYVCKNKDIGYDVSNGLHPWLIEKYPDFSKDFLRTIVLHNRAKAIGECGLDRLKGPTFKEQLAIFDIHLELAEELNLPVIVHCVRMYDELWNRINGLGIPMILHGFSASKEQYERFLSLENVYFSIGKKSFYRNKEKFIIPLKRLFLESDSSRYSMREFYEEVATYYGVSRNDLQIQMEENAANASIIWH